MLQVTLGQSSFWIFIFYCFFLVSEDFGLFFSRSPSGRQSRGPIVEDVTVLYCQGQAKVTVLGDVRFTTRPPESDGQVVSTLEPLEPPVEGPYEH